MKEDCYAHSQFSVSRGKKNHSLEVNAPCRLDISKCRKTEIKMSLYSLEGMLHCECIFPGCSKRRLNLGATSSQEILLSISSHVILGSSDGVKVSVSCMLHSCSFTSSQKLKIQMLLPILLLAPFCLRERKHKAGDQPHSTNTTRNCEFHVPINN